MENMKLTPTLDKKKIEKLKKEIPDINVFTEYTGEKPLPKDPDPSFMARMANEFDKKIDKLLNHRI